jgi:septal ring factor EnvC (AmiA/AmiB activator)
MKTQAMNDVENRITKLEQRRQRLDARLTGMRARASIADTKRQNRRRLVAGSVVLSALDSGDEVWSLVARVLLDKALKHPSERALFQLDF